MRDREERLMDLARETLQIPPGQRESYLLAACHQDKDLYSEVSEIVEWEERMGDFMRDPLVGLIDLEALDRPFKPGQLVADRFEIIREVGDGGMGVVYEANDRKRQQRIAIKCAKLGYERLSPELRGALKVRHPNVCLVNEIHTAATDLGELDFLTMEFLDGETLFSRLSHGKLEHNEALQLAPQLCAGLAEAHRCGVLHRDLKPANVILSPEKNKELRAVITDFGLAADQDGNTDLIGGTLSYMAPELKQDGTASPASDVYALGVILHEMVTGSKPFPEVADSNQPAQLSAVSSKLVKKLPRIWFDAIRPCLETRPEKRPSAEQILAVLNRKPLYLRPRVAIAALVLLTAGSSLWRPIYGYFRSPDIKLAILPVGGPGDIPRMGELVLHDVTQRLAARPNGKLKFLLIPPDAAAKKGVATLGQAESVLHATHALQLAMHRDQGDIAVEAAVIDLKTQAHVGDYSGHFAEADLGDLSGGLAGSISAALHLPGTATPERVSLAAKAAYESGRNYLRQGRYSYNQAIAQFQQAAVADRHSPLPFAGLAEAYVAKYNVEKNKQAQEAARAYLQAGEMLDPDSPQIRTASAGLNIALGRNAQALDDCRRALEIDPRNTEAWIRCGFAYEMQGESDKALEAYTKAIELDPSYYKPYQYLGGYYYYRGKFAEAEQQYKKEVEHALNDLDGYSDLGATLTEQSKYTEAEMAFKTALQIKETPSNLNNMGATLEYLGRDDEALSFLARAAKLEPKNHRYWMNLGDAHRRLGHAAKAAGAYRELLLLTSEQIRSNPASGSIRAFMAYALARLGRWRDAKEEIAQALQSPANDNQLIRNGVLTYEALGMRQSALKCAAQTTPEARISIKHHPDLADFSQDPRFIQLMAQSD
ncbi:MAG TPA: protein kinase [Candidatus Angelobacter sp.]|nr:protein kinase [Candidatus Angelobacter sp.]